MVNVPPFRRRTTRLHAWSWLLGLSLLVVVLAACRDDDEPQPAAVVAPAYSRDPLERLLLGLEPLPERTPAGLAAELRRRGFQYLVWSEIGYEFKRGFPHYRLTPEAQALLDGFRRTQLTVLAAADRVTLYVLAGDGACLPPPAAVH